MRAVKLDDIRNVRKALGASQSEAAQLLGLSSRAVQSYEQGLRSVPAQVQRLAATLLYLNWRKKHRRHANCWQMNRCKAEARTNCPRTEYLAGDFCWMIAGTYCRGTRQQSLAAKLAVCQKCPVMRKWLQVPASR